MTKEGQTTKKMGKRQTETSRHLIALSPQFKIQTTIAMLTLVN